MATYYVKSTGTNTWPFSSETTAAPTLWNLFTELEGRGILLGFSDIIQISGLITETAEYQTWLLRGALIQGTNSEVDQINIGSNELNSGTARRLNIWSDHPFANVYLFNFYEVSYCRIGYTASEDFEGSTFVIMVYYTGLVGSIHIFNNLFYKFSPSDNYVDVEINTGDAPPHLTDIIVESNTFVNLNSTSCFVSGPVNIDKLYVRNNIFSLDADGFAFSNDLAGGYSIADFQHKNNCFYPGTPVYLNHSVPFSMDVSEIVSDPLFIGSGDEPYRLQNGSPAKNGGFHFTETPTDDLVGTLRPVTPSMGSLEDTGIAPVLILQPSDALRNPAETVSFSALAEAVPDATYAWSFDGTTLVNGGRISGADSTLLTINTLIPEDTGTYSIRAYNGVLPDATASALLTVRNFPRFLLTDFIADATNGVAPFFVNFTNLSTGWMADSSVASFDWNFRDGSIDSTVMNPLHIFTKPGTYTISLKETRNAFSDTRVRLDYISLTSNSVNYYDNYPSRNDSTVISTIYLPVLFPMLSGDSYFTDETQIGRVNLYFVHEDGWQKKRIVHTGPDLTGSILWTSTAKTGLWLLEAIRVFDTDGAIHAFGRDNTTSDVIML